MLIVLTDIVPALQKNLDNSDLQNIMTELEKLKSYLNNVELQLYEANEHIAELLEKVSVGMSNQSNISVKDVIFLNFTETRS